MNCKGIFHNFGNNQKQKILTLFEITQLANQYLYVSIYVQSECKDKNCIPQINNLLLITQ